MKAFLNDLKIAVHAPWRGIDVCGQPFTVVIYHRDYCVCLFSEIKQNTVWFRLESWQIKNCLRAAGVIRTTALFCFPYSSTAIIFDRQKDVVMQSSYSLVRVCCCCCYHGEKRNRNDIPQWKSRKLRGLGCMYQLCAALQIILPAEFYRFPYCSYYDVR